MKFIKSVNGLEFLNIQQPPFDQILNGFFSRKGGVSPDPYKSLNLSTSTGDSNDNVRENRRKIFEAIDKPVSSVYDVWQIHSDKIVCTEKPKVDGQELVRADAIFTDKPEVTLMMKFADCVPILIFDPVKKVIGIIHAGWQGTIKQIAGKSVQKISRVYGSKPENIYAVIGPSIGPDHYEVGENVYRVAKDLFNDNDQIINKKDGKFFFNLWAANQEILERAGVNQILQTRICTACQTDIWYSHRAESGKTGRFAAIISMN